MPNGLMRARFLPWFLTTKKMIRLAIKQLLEKAIHHPLGFALLPKKFTMSQLQTLYEAIFAVVFDRPNFEEGVKFI
jgi:hypothetical protein